jgi:putative transposase
VKYAWIQQHTAFSVSRMCRLLEVSRSGYYEWLGRPPSIQADADRQVQAKVQHYFAQGRGTYGTRRIKYLLAQEGLRVSRRRIGRLLAQAGLRCKTRQKFKAPTAAGQAQTVAPNQLNRAFTVQAPHKVYVGISPICLQVKADCISPSSSICARGRSSGGRWPTICGRSW